MTDKIELALHEKTVLQASLDIAFGKILKPDGSHTWDSNDSGFDDDTLNGLWEKLK